VESNPDVVRRFVNAFFGSIAYMKANRDKTIEITSRVLNQQKSTMARVYDYEISMFLDDGRFNPKAVAVIKDSFVDMGLLPDKPKDDQLFTTAFVPAKP